MPTLEMHLAQARHNEELAVDLLPTQFTDWAATCCFYAGLHYIEAYLHTLEISCQNHGLRESEIRRHNVTRAIYKEYGRLKAWSESARYNAYRVPPELLTQQVIPSLTALRTHLERFTNTASRGATGAAS